MLKNGGAYSFIDNYKLYLEKNKRFTPTTLGQFAPRVSEFGYFDQAKN